VASKFTAETLKLAPFELPVPKVVPYGSGSPSRNIAPKFSGNRKLELLYVGAITQRKGLSYLFDAVKPLRNFCNLTLIGMDHSESQVLSQSANQQSWYRSLPHEAVLAKMKTCDILVFPSLFEGFGLVITEALSQGLPVVTTSNTAGPDLIFQGKNGWIVDPHSHRQIQEVLENILMGQANLDDMKEHAYLGSQSRSWATYQSEILDAIL
jgi:glycosyltransferase involved in cell wall biosynthesis